MSKECLRPIEPGIMTRSVERDQSRVGQHPEQGVGTVTHNIGAGPPHHERGDPDARELFKGGPLPKTAVDGSAHRRTTLAQSCSDSAVEV